MKAVIYARYSSDNQREESIEGQIREYAEYAKYNDMEIVGQYIDRAYSAKTDNRPRLPAYDQGQLPKAVRYRACVEARPLCP